MLGLPATIGTTVAYSHVYALDGCDRATAIFTISQIYGGAASSDRLIAYESQTSLDGTNWVANGPSDSAQEVTSSANPPIAITASVNGVFIRFKFVLERPVAADTAGVLFSVHVNLYKR